MALSAVVAKAGIDGVQPWKAAVGAASLRLSDCLCFAIYVVNVIDQRWKKSAVWLHILGYFYTDGVFLHTQLTISPLQPPRRILSISNEMERIQVPPQKKKKLYKNMCIILL